MTLCIGLSTSRGVWIGADSGSTADDVTEVVSCPKIWRNNGWLIGCAGNWRALEIMRYDLEFPNPGTNPHRALCMDLNTSLKQSFERNEWTIKVDSDGETDESDAYWILAARDNALWYIDYNGHVERMKRCAIGTGAAYAMGIIDSSDLGSAEKRIRRAMVQSAKRYRCLIGPYSVEKA